MLRCNILMTPCTVGLGKKNSLSYRYRVLKVILDPCTKGDQDERLC